MMIDALYAIVFLFMGFLGGLSIGYFLKYNKELDEQMDNVDRI